MNAFCEAIDNSQMNRNELAHILGVSASALSQYKSGVRNIPDNILTAVAKVTKNPALRAERCMRCDVALFRGMYLDNVDIYPMVEKDSLIKELGEALEAAHQLNFRNKRTSEDFTNDEMEELHLLNEQIADLYTTLQMYFISIIKYFDYDIDTLEKRLHKKYTVRKYRISKI